jgi:hypothetical protein
MFRKLVSSLAFSPALVGQLGFYAKRLKKEETTRRLGLIFTALALVVQSFAVFQPPTAANASSNADFVRGGVTSVSDFLTTYDQNSRNIKDLFNSLGITREEIKDAKLTTIGEEGHYNWSMTSLYSYAQGQRSYTFYDAQGNSDTVYHRPMTLTQEGGPTHKVYAGNSKKFGWFAIKKDCGNLITKKRPTEDKPPTSSCERLKAFVLERTRIRFDATAKVTSPARIKSYTFIVKDKLGKKVDSKEITSNAENASYTYTQTKPGQYTVSVMVDTTLGKKTDKDCAASFVITALPVPTAICSSLGLEIVGRTNVELTGSAVTGNGATVSKYTFVIKDATGKVVSTKVVTTTQLLAASDAFVVTTPGNYTAYLTVTTSLGDKTDAKDCVEKFTIVPPEMCPVKPSLPVNDKDCQPCPGNPNIWIKDEACDSKIIETKIATNIDQGDKDASSVLANASDRISYILTIANTGYLETSAPIVEELGDVMEYADVIDNGGGTFDAAKKTLTWPTIQLKPGEKQSRTFVVRLASTIPATNYGQSDSSSYNCIMTNTFGNSVDVGVVCPVQKLVVEQVVRELPKTGTSENMLFAGVLFTIVTYFYARSKQTNKEIRLIRRDLDSGTI